MVGTHKLDKQNNFNYDMIFIISFFSIISNQLPQTNAYLRLDEMQRYNC